MTGERGPRPDQSTHPALTRGALVMGTLNCRRWPAGQAEITTRVFLGHRDQVARARQFVRAVLGRVPVVDAAVLLVSELCTNALVHTASGESGTFEVAVYLSMYSVRVEVRDGGAIQAPVAGQPASTFAEDGRGLGLVELLADRWGYNGDQHGRSVYFELRWKQPD